MNAENRDAELPQAPAGETPPSASRRRLFRGVAGGAGVLLSVQAKTALGTTSCRSPSADISNSGSRPVSQQGFTCTAAKPPGYWCTQGQPWPSGCSKPSVKSNWRVATGLDCPNGYVALTNESFSAHGLLVADVFTGAPASLGFWEAMYKPAATADGALLQALCAAYLSRKTDASNYPVTEDELTRMWLTRSSGYCPASVTCVGTKDRNWVISFLTSLAPTTTMPKWWHRRVS